MNLPAWPTPETMIRPSSSPAVPKAIVHDASTAKRAVGSEVTEGRHAGHRGARGRDPLLGLERELRRRLAVVGGLLYTLGGVVYGLKRPNPSPRWFGFHEVFHSFTVLAFAAHYVGVSLATYSLR